MSMFIDEAKIHVKAGDGGDGIVSFHRDKIHPKGIPDGGNGGKGGNIVFKVDEGINTLQYYRFNQHFKAEKGIRGGSNKKNGKGGNDFILKVPPGTLIKDIEGKIIFDLTEKGKRYILAKGGVGGYGNAHFANNKYKAPRFAHKGEMSEKLIVRMELKVLADVGIIGFPNVGKSTLISVISRAKPKIADYPFTTLTPNLGVVQSSDGYFFTVADIPGLIQGAHKGKGLGDAFLRHIERARILVHVLDVQEKGLMNKFNALNKELELYSDTLAQKYQVVVLNKIDLLTVAERKKIVDRLKKQFKEKKVRFFPTSAYQKKGINQLIDFLGREVSKRTIKIFEKKEEKVYRIPAKERLTDYVIEKGDRTYRIRGKLIERLVKMTDLNNEEALDYLSRQFKKARVNERLVKEGIKEGDMVEIAGKEFDFTLKLAE